MEGDAGSRRLNPTDADETPDESLAVSQDPSDLQTQEATAEDFPEADPEPGPTDTRRPSRLGRGWVAAICAALLVLAGAGAVGGYLALKSNQQSEDSSRAEAAALQAARDCVAATHAPDTAAMTAAQSKIIECSTGDFGAQASLYSRRAGRRVPGRERHGAGIRHARRGRTAQCRRIVRDPGRGAGEGDQLRDRRPGTGLPAARADGARRRHLQDRQDGSGHRRDGRTRHRGRAGHRGGARTSGGGLADAGGCVRRRRSAWALR